MGRPLSKKFFGNRNVGTTSTADNKIGGEGVASYGTIVASSGWTTQPTASISAPNIPGGVTATGTFRYKALGFAVTANGTGYNIGDLLEVDTGTQTTKARALVESVNTVTATVANGGTNWAVGDTWTISGPGWVQALQVTVATIGGGGATGPAETVTIVQEGRRDVTAPPNPVGITSAITATGGGTYNLDLTWGVFSFGTVTIAGDYTAFPSTGAAGTLTSVTPATGTGAKADITMGLFSVIVTQRGSGYTTPADAALVFSPAATPTNASATAALTTDTGAVGSATNQENAIIIRANVSDNGNKIGDIIKQVSTRRYKVKTADGTGIVKLTSNDAAPDEGAAMIIATDSGGSTYFVYKLTARKVVLYRKDSGPGGFEFNNGQPVIWTFGIPQYLYSVQVENA